MFTIAGRTFVWWKLLLCLIVFSILWLTTAGLLASRRLVQVHFVPSPQGSQLILLAKDTTTPITGLGGCARHDGSFATEVFSHENSQRAQNYTQRNQCIEFKQSMDAVRWASWPPRFWNVTNVH